MDYQALEGLGGRLITVVKREVNIANVSVTVVPLTFDQFRALGITVNASTDLDPAECMYVCMSIYACIIARLATFTVWLPRSVHT